MSIERDLSLVVRDVVDTNGSRPCSVSIKNNLVCALNCGGEESDRASVQCFHISKKQKLQKITGFYADVNRNIDLITGLPFPWQQTPSQISISNDGDTIIVASKDVGMFSYRIDYENSCLTLVTEIDTKNTIIDSRVFAFNEADDGIVVAVNTFDNENFTAKLESYQLNKEDGSLRSLNQTTIADFGDACWSDYRDGYIYVIAPNLNLNNVDPTATSKIQSFRVHSNGTLELIATVSTVLNLGRPGPGPFSLAGALDGKISVDVVDNPIEWNMSQRNPLLTLEEKTDPIGRSFMSTIELLSNGEMAFRDGVEMNLLAATGVATAK
eukprot:Pgem_evm1s5364